MAPTLDSAPGAGRHGVPTGAWVAPVARTASTAAAQRSVLSSLGDAARRRLYDHVAAQVEPVSREEVATAAGIGHTRRALSADAEWLGRELAVEGAGIAERDAVAHAAQLRTA